MGQTILREKNFNEVIISLLASLLIIFHLFLPKQSEKFIELDEQYQHQKNICVAEARREIFYEIVDSDIQDAEKTLLYLKSKIEPYKKEIRKHNSIADLRDQEISASKFGNYTNLRSFVFILGISFVFLVVCISNLSKSYKYKSNLVSGVVFISIAIFMLIRISLPQDIPTWVYLFSFTSSFFVLLCGSIYYSKWDKDFKKRLTIALGVIITIKHRYFVELAARLTHKEETGDDLPIQTSISEEVEAFDNYISENLERINRGA